MCYFNIDEKLSTDNFLKYEILWNSLTDDFKVRLRTPHRTLYTKLLHLLFLQNNEANKNGTEPGLVLKTNNVVLAKEFDCCTNTIINWKKRLIDNKLITEVYHGHANNYDIVFNKFLVPLMDHNYYQKIPLSYKSSDSLVAYSQRVMTKSLRSHINLLNTFINKLNKAECLNNELCYSLNNDFTKSFRKNPEIKCLDDYLSMLECFGYEKTAKTTHTLNNDTRKEERAEPSIPQENDLKNNQGGDPAKEITENLPFSKKMMKKIKSQHIRQNLKSHDVSELRFVYAWILYNYALEFIPTWKKRVFPGIAGNVVLYISENYFNDCENLLQIEKKFNIYKDTIGLASRYIRTQIADKQWDNYYTLPVTYFDINYNKGFRHWISKAEEKALLGKKKYREKCRKSTIDKLNSILADFMLNQSQINLMRCRAKVEKEIPGRLNQFDSCVKNKIEVVNYYWINTKTA